MLTPPLRRRTDQEAGSTVRLRALVVDDNDVYRDYVTSLVSRFGFEVTACADGVEALEVLSTGGEFFDFLVVDCEMPRLGGLDLIRAVRTQESHHDVYAVLLTGREDVETRIAALRIGFDDCMVKSSGERELSAKFGAARRLVTRQKHLDDRVHELYRLATRDDLTGLFNRRFFFSEAERLLDEGNGVNLIFFDLDEFKPINDTLGHLAGDRILRDLGSLFLKRTRSVDLIARYGGDEFVMLVPTLSPTEVEALAHRMASEIASAQWVFGTEIFSVGITTGISCSSLLEKPTLAQLISAGDRDLYKNKWLRKNPDQDPSLYEYDSNRDAHVIELMTLDGEEHKAKKADG
jgi:two-component system, cell cycle response regulator